MRRESVDRKTLLKLGVGAAALVSVPSVEAARQPPKPSPVTQPSLDLAGVEDLLAAGQFVGLARRTRCPRSRRRSPTPPRAARFSSGRSATRCRGRWISRIGLTSACSRTAAAPRSTRLYGTYFVPTNAEVGAMVVCAPPNISQHGPSIEGININNEPAFSGIGGF